jgi:putative glutamine amidotransferase
MPQPEPTTDKPLVAISGKAEHYAEWILRSGGMYRLMVPRENWLDAVSGLLLTGGEDVDPALYGEVNRCSRVNPERDTFELELLEVALGRDLPVLAVCRGMQLLTVALGGSLYQDLSELSPGPSGGASACHRGPEHTDTTHPVDIEPQSFLGRCVDQQTLLVNSHHHQGVRDLPADLRVCGRSRDGLIEAVEHRSRRWVLGLQWHPECWPCRSSDAIMKLFLAECESYHSSRLRKNP